MLCLLSAEKTYLIVENCCYWLMVLNICIRENSAFLFPNPILSTELFVCSNYFLIFLSFTPSSHTSLSFIQLREYEWYYRGRSRRLLKFHVLITTYDDLIRDYEEMAEVSGPVWSECGSEWTEYGSRDEGRRRYIDSSVFVC